MSPQSSTKHSSRPSKATSHSHKNQPSSYSSLAKNVTYPMKLPTLLPTMPTPHLSTKSTKPVSTTTHSVTKHESKSRMSSSPGKHVSTSTNTKRSVSGLKSNRKSTPITTALSTQPSRSSVSSSLSCLTSAGPCSSHKPSRDRKTISVSKTDPRLKSVSMARSSASRKLTTTGRSACTRKQAVVVSQPSLSMKSHTGSRRMEDRAVVIKSMPSSRKSIALDRVVSGGHNSRERHHHYHHHRRVVVVPESMNSKQDVRRDCCGCGCCKCDIPNGCTADAGHRCHLDCC